MHFFNAELLQEIKLRLMEDLQGSGPLPVPPEDLVGDVLLRLMTTGEWQEIRSPFAYARRVLQNLIRDHLRRLKRTKQLLEDLAASRPLVVEENQETGDLENGELVNYLLEHSGLTCLQKRVTQMLYLQGMTLTEVARELSKNAGTIVRHRDRALVKLGQCAVRVGAQP